MNKNIKFPIMMISLLFLASCASDKYSCGVPSTEASMGCVKTGEVYRVKVLGQKKGNKNKPIIRESDGAHILTQPDILDRQLHRFNGSVQALGQGSPLAVKPITREPVYRSVYIPGETVITKNGKHMRVMPRVLVVEQVPGGFIDGPLDGAITNPLQYRIPIQSEYQKKSSKKK